MLNIKTWIQCIICKYLTYIKFSYILYYNLATSNLTKSKINQIKLPFTLNAVRIIDKAFFWSYENVHFLLNFNYEKWKL